MLNIGEAYFKEESMIFVTLGTQDKSFKRLLDIMEDSINKNEIKEEVIVQAGYTKYKSDKMKIFDYINMEDFDEYMEKCDLLITHGGVGSILSGLKYKKKVIAVPRLSKYLEHTNDHQIQIVDNLYEEGYILKLDENDKLGEVLKKAKTFKPKEWKFNNENILKKIEEFISNN